jgi:hypothetical protein
VLEERPADLSGLVCNDVRGAIVVRMPTNHDGTFFVLNLGKATPVSMEPHEKAEEVYALTVELMRLILS